MPLLLMPHPEPWLPPMLPPCLCASAWVGIIASKNRARNKVVTLFIVFTSNKIEARDSDSLSVRRRLSHAAGVTHVTACVRSALHVVPVAMRIHPAPVAATRKTRHWFPHHFRRGRPLVAADPDRLSSFHHHFITGMKLVCHADKSFSDTHPGIAGWFNSDTENGSPHSDDRSWCRQRFGIGSATQLLNLHPHVSEQHVKEFLPRTGLYAQYDMGVGKNADRAAIGHPDGG